MIYTGQLLAGIYDRYHMYYITLYNLKSTQEYDSERNKHSVQTIIRRLIWIQSSKSINLIHAATTDLISYAQLITYSISNVPPKKENTKKVNEKIQYQQGD